MLRLRNSILPRLLSFPATSRTSPLHRLLSAAAPAVSPNPSFAVEDYLVGTCGLTRAQALKASAKLSHLKSPSNPDAVLAFLAGLGLSNAEVAAVVAKDPKFLCTGVERTVAPIVVELTGLGLSRSEVARLVSLAPMSFRSRSIVCNLPYYLSLFGSCDNVLRALKGNSSFLSADLDAVVKPNVALLGECGLGARDITKLCLSSRLILAAQPEHVRAMVARAEAVGVRRGSGMFRQALLAVASLSKEKIATQLECLKNTFRWSNAELGIAVCKFPMMLTRSKDVLRSRSEFLISEVGLEPPYIARRPAMLSYSLEGRLRPRYYVLKFLKENGLRGHERDYYSTVAYKEKLFVERYICPHKEAAPHLAEDYAAACRRELPTRFRFT